MGPALATALAIVVAIALATARAWWSETQAVPSGSSVVSLGGPLETVLETGVTWGWPLGDQSACRRKKSGSQALDAKETTTARVPGYAFPVFGIYPGKSRVMHFLAFPVFGTSPGKSRVMHFLCLGFLQGGLLQVASRTSAFPSLDPVQSMQPMLYFFMEAAGTRKPQ